LRGEKYGARAETYDLTAGTYGREAGTCVMLAGTYRWKGGAWDAATRGSDIRRNALGVDWASRRGRAYANGLENPFYDGVRRVAGRSFQVSMR